MIEEPRINKALQIETQTTINHWELGRLFGEWSNEEQFAFLHGAAIEFQEMRGFGVMQLHYLATEAAKFPNPQMDVQLFVHSLHDYINPEEDAK